MNKGYIWDKVWEFYNDNIPDYINNIGKTWVSINIEDPLGEYKLVRIHISDIMDYYKNQAPNISSGMRSIAGVYGDWRMIDNLAREIHELFKCINIKECRKEAKRHGLTPKY